MKALHIIGLLFVALTSCGQSTSNNGTKVSHPSVDQAIPVYQAMTTEICNCTSTKMRNSKPSTSFDSCYKATVIKYTDTLNYIGFDPGSPKGKNMLTNEIRINLCSDLYSLMQMEWSERQAKKEIFKGEFISQKKIETGKYAITLKDSKTNELKGFIAKNPLDEGTIKKYLSGYEVTVEYEIVKNDKSKKDEYYIKEGGSITTIGAVQVEN